MSKYEALMARTEQFRKNRFGLFVHYGLYSIHAVHEWSKSREQISDADYAPYFDAFTAEHYDPRAWAKAAKRAGMRYAVLTTKHHEGFCLFDSQYTDYKATNTPAGRDLVREFVDAFRAEGLQVGFYYSLLDWHHPDYPCDGCHPMRNHPEEVAKEKHFERYVEYMHNQVRELMTNYGKIDIVWFDFSYEDMTGEKWRATELCKMVRSLQPGILIDNRLSKERHYDVETAPDYAGDFFSPEQFIPTEGMRDPQGRPLPWETCLTSQSESWGYQAYNDNFMTAKDVIHTLVDCVSKGGNLLLNIGPNGKGEFPPQAMRLLEEVGEWMYQNGESIHGCDRSDLPQPAWGRMTQKGNNVYLHFFDKLGYCQAIEGMPREDVYYAVYLQDNSEMPLKEFWNHDCKTANVSVVFPKAQLPDEIDTVIKLVLKK